MTMQQQANQQAQKPFTPFQNLLQSINYYVGRLNMIEPELGHDTVDEAIKTWWKEHVVPGVEIALQAKGLNLKPNIQQKAEIYARKNEVVWAEQKLRNIVDYMSDVVEAFNLGAPLPTFAIRDAMELLGMPMQPQQPPYQEAAPLALPPGPQNQGVPPVAPGVPPQPQGA